MTSEEAPRPDAALLYEQVLQSMVSLEGLPWLAAGFQRHARAGGALSLERALGLPTDAQRQRALRDLWIARAARHVAGDTPAARAEALAAELDAFLRGTWKEWRHRRDPPPSASPLRRDLHELAYVLRGRPRPCTKRLA